MRVRVGTSGYSYKEWKGSFYPDDMKPAGMLRFYAQRFPTVEINNTFYRLPTSELLANWAAEVPDGFSFVLKASRRITHEKRLSAESADTLLHLLETASVLGPKLGPVLFQLPPFLKKDAPRLRDFLGLLPERRQAAFEFRHASWFDDEVLDLLRARGAALCIADVDAEDGPAAPFTSTARWGYLRLRKPEYTEADIAAWAARIRAQPWDEAYVFFKHEDAGKGPALAAQLIARLQD